MEKQLATIEQSMKALTLTSDEVGLIKDLYGKNATDMEFKLFIAIAQYTDANPILKEIYLIIYGEGAGRKMTICHSIHWMEKRMDRTGLWMGYTEPQYLDKEGKWLDVWVNPDIMPVAIKIGSKRKGWSEPAYATVYWKERNKNQAEWKNQPLWMLTKCAKAAANREVFPTEFGAAYIHEEMLNEEKPPDHEWIPDPAKPASENTHDMVEGAKARVTEEKNFKAGDVSGSPTPEQLADYDGCLAMLGPEVLSKERMKLYGKRKRETYSRLEYGLLLEALKPLCLEQEAGSGKED